MKKRTVIVVLAVLVIVVAVFVRRGLVGTPVDYSSDIQSKDFDLEFRYGSIGSDNGGLPYKIWHVLPVLFPEYLPDKGAGGKNYASLGLIYEKGHTQPIGMSLRKGFVDSVGLNCAVCHTGTWRESESGEVHAVSGMPAHQFDLGGYFGYLFACNNDPRFTEENVTQAIKNLDGLTVIEKLIMPLAFK
ncbi:MAG TPA: hypothetical protein VGO11_00260 [Chthoniobacteraceae bacterium]|nr:hypothetical protein [Chthoniobacteraceae bacterium]